eukprot:scaffold1191_cov115-Amphora_coffeaeformis.AAC.1
MQPRTWMGRAWSLVTWFRRLLLNLLCNAESTVCGMLFRGSSYRGVDSHPRRPGRGGGGVMVIPEPAARSAMGIEQLDWLANGKVVCSTHWLSNEKRVLSA